MSLLDEREDVTEVENSARHAVGVERLELVETFTGGCEQNRATRARDNRKCGTTAGVTVELRENDTREVDTLLKRLGRGNRILTDHRVDDEQNLVGVRRLANLGCLLHHLGVNAESAGCVDDDDVVNLIDGVLDRLLGDLDRVAHAVARLGSEHRDAGLLADDL
ncbi:unannotated protein [freshwater metagenome]|uniref:Unannotated protein n=1 Tax=freshwater metagenome TaxID=449393 RepID=A0A6J6E4F5_9ZZZZ